VWAFLITPQNMHLWGPATRPVTGIDRLFQAGDRVTLYRRDFVRTQRQVLLVEQVVPYRALHFRDLSPGAARLNVTATLSVEEAEDRGATWVEEAISYSLGRGRVLHWLDRWVINPLIQPLMGYQTAKAFRRMRALLEEPPADSGVGSGQENRTAHERGSEPS
jgi:hypothetical protein